MFFFRRFKIEKNEFQLFFLLPFCVEFQAALYLWCAYHCEVQVWLITIAREQIQERWRKKKKGIMREAVVWEIGSFLRCM